MYAILRKQKGNQIKETTFLQKLQKIFKELHNLGNVGESLQNLLLWVNNRSKIKNLRTIVQNLQKWTIRVHERPRAQLYKLYETNERKLTAFYRTLPEPTYKKLANRIEAS